MIEVKEVNEDEYKGSLDLKYHPRRLKIVSKGKVFYTPTRVITDAEYVQKRKFPNAIPIDDFISSVTNYMHQDELASFIGKNGAIKKLTKKVKEFSKPSIDSFFRILSLKLSIDDFKWVTEQDKMKTFLRFLDFVQGPLESRSFPYIPAPMDVMSSVYDEFCKVNDNPVIWIDLKEEQNAFQKRLSKIENLIKEKRLQVLGIHYEKFEEVNVNYDQLYEKFHNLDVLLLMEGVPYRYNINDPNLSSYLHAMPFAALDAISPVRRDPYSRTGKRKGFGRMSNKSLQNLSFFKRNDVSIRRFNEISKDNSIITEYEPQSTIKEDWHTLSGEIDNPKAFEDEELKRKYRRLYAFSYVQKAVDGQKEMEAISDSVKNSESSDYLAARKQLFSEIEKHIIIKK